MGEQKDRFKGAMEEHNNWIILNGQPDAVHHICDKCMRVYQMDVEYRKVMITVYVRKCLTLPHHLGKCQIIVGDGINMGHPCCGIFRCTILLENNWHR